MIPSLLITSPNVFRESIRTLSFSYDEVYLALRPENSAIEIAVRNSNLQLWVCETSLEATIFSSDDSCNEYFGLTSWGALTFLRFRG
jgi:hypothetical protein